MRIHRVGRAGSPHHAGRGSEAVKGARLDKSSRVRHGREGWRAGMESGDQPTVDVGMGALVAALAAAR